MILEKLRPAKIAGLLAGGLTAGALIRENNEFLELKRKYAAKSYSGIVHNNPGNLRIGSLSEKLRTGAVNGPGGQFATFGSMTDGYRQYLILIQGYNKAGRLSAREIIRTYAPASENDTAGYINFVANKAGFDASDRIFLATNYNKMAILAKAMFRMEQGTEKAYQPLTFLFAWLQFMAFDSKS